MTLLSEVARSIWAVGGRAAATGQFTSHTISRISQGSSPCGVTGLMWTGARSMTYAPFKRVRVPLPICNNIRCLHTSPSQQQAFTGTFLLIRVMRIECVQVHAVRRLSTEVPISLRAWAHLAYIPDRIDFSTHCSRRGLFCVPVAVYPALCTPFPFWDICRACRKRPAGPNRSATLCG